MCEIVLVLRVSSKSRSVLIEEAYVLKKQSGDFEVGERRREERTDRRVGGLGGREGGQAEGRSTLVK